MRGVRFDQYEFPSFRTILSRIGLWCVALLMPLLAFYFILNDELIYAPFLMVFCLGASCLLYKEYKQAVTSYQARRDQCCDHTLQCSEIRCTAKVRRFSAAVLYHG